MKLNKKAAIELSMQTIVVIVIGVTILSLGLLWVQNTFRDVGDISDEAFQNAQEVLSSDSEFGGRTSSATSIRLEKNVPKVLVVQIRNDGSVISDTIFSIQDPPTMATGLTDAALRNNQCLVAKVIAPTSKKIANGEVKNIDVGFRADKSCPSGNAIYNLRIMAGSNEYDTVSVTLSIS